MPETTTDDGRWVRKDDVEHEDKEFHVSTVELRVAHGPDRDQHYETAVGEGDGLEVKRRYETQEEAEAGHEEILDALGAGEYDYEVVARRLVLDVD